MFRAETEGELKPNIQYTQDAQWWDCQEELPLQDHVNTILDRMLGTPEGDPFYSSRIRDAGSRVVS